MAYIWDDKNIIKTFDICAESLRRSKDGDITFLRFELDSYGLRKFNDTGLVITVLMNGISHRSLITGAGLCYAIDRTGLDSDVDFNHLSNDEYIKLCKFIVRFLFDHFKQGA